jgi:hypothetical protein
MSRTTAKLGDQFLFPDFMTGYPAHGNVPAMSIMQKQFTIRTQAEKITIWRAYLIWKMVENGDSISTIQFY